MRPAISGLIGCVACALLIAACGSSGSSSSENSSSSSTGGTQSASAAKLPPPNTCTPNACNVYKNLSWKALGGQTVGILNVAPVPGATRWSAPLRSCLESHGAKVNYVDIGGDDTKMPPTMQTWLSSGVKAIFDIGIPLAGEDSLIKEAASKHVPIITYGAGAPTGVIALDADQTEDGRMIGRYLVKTLPHGFTVAELYDPTAPPHRERIAGVEAVVKPAGAQVRRINVSTGASVEGAQQATAALLQADPNIDAIVGAYGDFAVGAANAVKAANAKAIVVGMNGDPDEYAAIRTGGPFKATVADPQEAAAQLACETATEVVGGGKPVGTSVFLSSFFVDKSNVPASGAVQDGPRKLTIKVK
jgi:ribose transport system substrate-binding protein